MPLGTLDHNGRPFGLAIITQAGREDLMFRFMSAFEANFEPRAVPKKLDSKSDNHASLWSIAWAISECAIDTLSNFLLGSNTDYRALVIWLD